MQFQICAKKGPAEIIMVWIKRYVYHEFPMMSEEFDLQRSLHLLYVKESCLVFFMGFVWLGHQQSPFTTQTQNWNIFQSDSN